MTSKFSKMKTLNLLLVLIISVAVPLQSVSAPAVAASTTASASEASTASDESIDEWMPDKVLQQVVLAALRDGGCSVNAGSRSDLTLSEIKPAMLADLRYFNSGAGKTTHVTGITNLKGLQYATGLLETNFTGSTIKGAPEDWSTFFNKIQNDGTLVVDASSADADLAGLAKLPTTFSYKLVNGNDVGMPNYADNPFAPKEGISVKTLTPGKNMMYDSDLSSMKAYIPLSNWYKGFVTSDGTYAYGKAVATYPTLPKGVTLDMTNHRFVVDLNVCGGHEVKIPSFAISDKTDDGKASYYNEGNTLDAVVPMSSVPVDTSQTVDVGSRTDPTGSINTATFGFGSATDAQLTINSGDLTAADITFTPDLAENKINFKLTSSGEQKLRAGDLESNITIAAGDASVKLTLKLAESLDTWMPSAALQTALKNAGVTTLTKSNLVSFNGPLNLDGISNLTGLEYARNLGSLKLTDCDLDSAGLGKATNSQVLSKLTGLTSLEIDGSQLGGSLADWGLKDETKLAHITAQNDNLTDPGTSDYADDENLESLDLSSNALNEDVSQVIGTWPKLDSLHLQSNQLTGSLPNLDGSPLLEQLYLSNNQLSGAVPDSYGNLSMLSDLELNDNQLSGTLPAVLGKDTALEDLKLYDNEFTGSIPNDWSALKNLQKLNLSTGDPDSQYKLDGNLDALASLDNLTEVNLNYNNFEGSLPTAWFTSELTSFQAINNQFSGALPDLSQAVNLIQMEYGGNHITSGTTKTGATGNQQRLSIDNPAWKTSNDGKTMTLDLSQYYGGEQGQSGYSNLDIEPAGGQTGVTLDKTDPTHPLLKIDTTSTDITNGDFLFYLFDQSGSQAVLNKSMNYMAYVTVPITVAIPKTYAIDTGTDDKIDFGSPKVGTGVAPAKNFKLGISSTNAAGDSYQLMAQTTGLTSTDGGHVLPVYYGNGHHQTLLTKTAQSIYDYQPTSNPDTTKVGDSQDATKGNLQTTIPSTTYAGKYTGTITYTLASAPANDPTTAAKTSDVGNISPTTVSQMSPTISGLSAEQEATRTTLQKNMTAFMPKLADSDGVLYSGYLTSQGKTDSPYQELTESSGLWLLSLAMAGDETDFDQAFSGVKARFYDTTTHTFNWQANGEEHKVTQGSASIDDLRIIQALLVMNEKSPKNDRTAMINELIDGFTKHDMNAYYQMIDGYSTASGQEKKIRLDYLDLATLKTVYEAKGLGTANGTAGGTAYQQQLKLIKDGYISDKLPMFNTYYDYSTGNYQVSEDNVSGKINVTDGLLTMLNLAKVGELPQTSLDWLKTNTANKTIYNDYNLDGTPATPYQAASNYAYVAQIAAALHDTTLYGQALDELKAMTATDTSSPLYGSAAVGGETYAFNDLNMLLAYNSVITK